jgi:hypothetical protein
MRLTSPALTPRPERHPPSRSVQTFFVVNMRVVLRKCVRSQVRLGMNGCDSWVRECACTAHLWPLSRLFSSRTPSLAAKWNRLSTLDYLIGIRPRVSHRVGTPYRHLRWIRLVTWLSSQFLAWETPTIGLDRKVWLAFVQSPNESCKAR